MSGKSRSGFPSSPRRKPWSGANRFPVSLRRRNDVFARSFTLPAAVVFLSGVFAQVLAADSAGTAFNRPGTDPTLERDARGVSQLAPEPGRAPGGRLHEAPYAIPSFQPFGNDWSYRFSAETGAVHGPGGAPALRDYGDYGSGVVLNHLHFGLERSATAHYFDFAAAAVGREDQHYRASAGRYGAFRASLHFSELPKLFTERARTVFQGAGTGSLTLPAGLVPGNNTPAQLSAALQSSPFFDLGFDRKRAGIEFEATPGAEWRFYASYRQDRKRGTRPFGGASGYPGAPAVELIEPLDHRTHDVAAGLQWTGATRQANLSYTGSFFRNAVDTLSWEHPLVVGDPAVVWRSRMDLHPDNNFHNLKLDVGAVLPLRGRLTGGLSLGRMTQDDALVAPTVNAGLLGATDLANWNTPAALSQPSARAHRHPPFPPRRRVLPGARPFAPGAAEAPRRGQPDALRRVQSADRAVRLPRPRRGRQRQHRARPLPRAGAQHPVRSAQGRPVGRGRLPAPAPHQRHTRLRAGENPRSAPRSRPDGRGPHPPGARQPRPPVGNGARVAGVCEAVGQRLPLRSQPGVLLHGRARQRPRDARRPAQA
jgi:hypothetical protein